MPLAVGPAQQDDGKQALDGQLFVQHAADGLGLEVAVRVPLDVMQEVDNLVGRRVLAHGLDERVEVERQVGELLIAGLLGAAEKVERQQVLAVVNDRDLGRACPQGLVNGQIVRVVNPVRRLAAERQRLARNVEQRVCIGRKVAQAGRLAAARFAQDQNWNPNKSSFLSCFQLYPPIE